MPYNYQIYRQNQGGVFNYVGAVAARRSHDAVTAAIAQWPASITAGCKIAVQRTLPSRAPKPLRVFRIEQDTPEPPPLRAVLDRS